MSLASGECALIDATAGLDLAPLGALIADASIVKILHDAQQDLTILRRATGRFPKHIFDTRCAAGFARLASTISLADLLAKVLGVDLSKTETRTDWLRRPLSERQVAYALDDVRHLPALREELLGRAASGGNERWLHEEMKRYDDPRLYAHRDPRTQFDRVKGSGRLNGRKLAVLRELAAWREEEAAHRDLPREQLMADRVLMSLATASPADEEALAGVEGVSRNASQRYAPELVRTIRRGLSVPSEQCPIPVWRLPRRRNVKTRVEAAFALVNDRSSSRGIDPHLVTTRGEVTVLAHEGRDTKREDHGLLQGWRYDLAGREVLALMSARRVPLAQAIDVERPAKEAPSREAHVRSHEKQRAHAHGHTSHVKRGWHGLVRLLTGRGGAPKGS
jgi:ribonuclease D